MNNRHHQVEVEATVVDVVIKAGEPNVVADLVLATNESYNQNWRNNEGNNQGKPKRTF